MRRLLFLLISTITSIVLGVSFVQAPSKVYDSTAYYKGAYSSDEPDFQATYREYSYFKDKPLGACDKSSVKLEGNTRAYVPTSRYGLRWFWGVSDGSPHPEYLMERSKDNPEGYTKIGDIYTWELKPENKYLVAIANSTLVAGTQHSESLYPKEEQTKGVHLGIVIKIPEIGKAFKVTYGTMEAWWCCMGKVAEGKPDNENKELPVYGHTVEFSDDDMFYAGTVIGLAGISGMPENNRKVPHLSIQIDECSLDRKGQVSNNWKSASLSDLYPKK